MAQIIASQADTSRVRVRSATYALTLRIMERSSVFLSARRGKACGNKAITEGQKDTGVTVIFEIFNGECCMSEINRIIEAVKAAGCDMISGVGGGKIHDTAKAVGYYAGIPVVIVPTIASTDAPCSALSVIYSEEGIFEKYLFLPSSRISFSLILTS